MKFAALKVEHPKECRRPQARVPQRPMGANLRLTCLWNPESGILGSGIQNTTQGIRNPPNDQNPESKIQDSLKTLKSSTWNPESKAWNPESKTVLD